MEREDNVESYKGKTAVHTPRREAFTGNVARPAHSWISDSWPPDQGRMSVLPKSCRSEGVGSRGPGRCDCTSRRPRGPQGCSGELGILPPSTKVRVAESSPVAAFAPSPWRS